MTERDEAPREALLDIKNLTCGDKHPNWSNDQATYATRSKIADICDIALIRERGGNRTDGPGIGREEEHRAIPRSSLSARGGYEQQTQHSDEQSRGKGSAAANVVKPLVAYGDVNSPSSGDALHVAPGPSGQPPASERRSGASKLVYDKTRRTIINSATGEPALSPPAHTITDRIVALALGKDNSPGTILEKAQAIARAALSETKPNKPNGPPRPSGPRGHTPVG